MRVSSSKVPTPRPKPPTNQDGRDKQKQIPTSTPDGPERGDPPKRETNYQDYLRNLQKAPSLTSLNVRTQAPLTSRTVRNFDNFDRTVIVYEHTDCESTSGKEEAPGNDTVIAPEVSYPSPPLQHLMPTPQPSLRSFDLTMQEPDDSTTCKDTKQLEDPAPPPEMTPEPISTLRLQPLEIRNTDGVRLHRLTPQQYETLRVSQFVADKAILLDEDGLMNRVLHRECTPCTKEEFQRLARQRRLDHPDEKFQEVHSGNLSQLRVRELADGKTRILVFGGTETYMLMIWMREENTRQEQDRGEPVDGRSGLLRRFWDRLAGCCR